MQRDLSANLNDILEAAAAIQQAAWKALMRAHLGDWEASAERLHQAASRCSGSLHPCR